MKAWKLTDAQKAFVVKQGEEGTPVAEICRKAGISQATYFNWKKRYAVSDRPCFQLPTTSSSADL
jgi:putative transposase